LAPERLREQFTDAKRWNDLGSPTLPQLVLAELISSGELDRHLRLVRGRQRRRRDAMVEEVRRLLPQTRIHGVAAGLHVLVTLAEGIDDRDIAQRAVRAGVRVQSLSQHRQLSGPPGLVLGYAAHSPDQIRHAIRRLAAAMAS
jgi:GntR family transcriptional regulator/MocR family aminotransferase